MYERMNEGIKEYKKQEKQVEEKIKIIDLFCFFHIYIDKWTMINDKYQLKLPDSSINLMK